MKKLVSTFLCFLLLISLAMLLYTGCKEEGLLREQESRYIKEIPNSDYSAIYYLPISPGKLHNQIVLEYEKLQPLSDHSRLSRINFVRIISAATNNALARNNLVNYSLSEQEIDRALHGLEALANNGIFDARSPSPKGAEKLIAFLHARGYIDGAGAEQFKNLVREIWPEAENHRAENHRKERIDIRKESPGQLLVWQLGKDILENSRRLWANYGPGVGLRTVVGPNHPDLLNKGSGMAASDAIMGITFTLIGGPIIGMGAGALASIIFSEEVDESDG